MQCSDLNASKWQWKQGCVFLSISIFKIGESVLVFLQPMGKVCFTAALLLLYDHSLSGTVFCFFNNTKFLFWLEVVQAVQVFFFFFFVNRLQQEQDQTVPRKRLLPCSDWQQHLQPVMFLLPRKCNVLTSFFQQWVACPTHAGNYFRKESFLLSSQ